MSTSKRREAAQALAYEQAASPEVHGIYGRTAVVSDEGALVWAHSVDARELVASGTYFYVPETPAGGAPLKVGPKDPPRR